MKLLIVTIMLTLLCAGPAFGQKGKAEPDFYPMGYSGDTWTGEVIEFNDELRTLTLSSKKGKDVETFIAVIPDAPYQWALDMSKSRVVDFPFNKKTNIQLYRYVGSGEFAGDIAPAGGDTRKIPNPPDTNIMSEFAQFKGRKITVYYSSASRTVSGREEKYNEVWRIRIHKK